MKKVTINLEGRPESVVEVPENCMYPKFDIFPCQAVHKSQPECDCRWCCFNKEFNQAHGKSREEEL